MKTERCPGAGRLLPACLALCSLAFQSQAADRVAPPKARRVSVSRRAPTPRKPPPPGLPAPPPEPTPAPVAPPPVDYADLKITSASFMNADRRTEPKRVAITFDAGFENKGVALILKTLRERHTRITFFLTGYFCSHYPKSTRAIADAGMELGNHSWSHPHFDKIPDKTVGQEIDLAEEAIIKACGRGSKPLFRFPFGDSDKRSRDLVAAKGWQSIDWTVDCLDTVGKRKTAEYMAERILTRLKPGDIVLMHVSSVETAEAFARVMERLDQLGIQVVPVSDLLLHPHGTPRPARAVAAVAGPRAARLIEEAVALIGGIAPPAEAK